MSVRFSSLLGTLILSSSCSLFSFVPKAQAETFNPDTIPLSPRSIGIDRQFERTFFSNDREAFVNRSIGRQFNFLFGPFPENEITRDSKALYKLYVDVMRQQVSNDPVIRTPDLANPYNTSLFQIGNVNVSAPVRGSEFIYEEQPPR